MSEQAYVTSDLHVCGGDADKPLEDFYQDKEFSDWLGAIAAPDTTLFINGDFIDFAQIPPYDTPDDRQFLWHEDQSLEKLESALAAHPALFDAIGAFLDKGAVLKIGIGNHDLDLAWPRVQTRFRERVGKPGTDKLTFSTEPQRYHGVLIEHGHAFTPENCPKDVRAFIHDHEGRDYLERVWGTDFMLSFYNALERKYPFADNVKPMASVMWHGMKNRWIGGRELVQLVLFLKRRGVPWSGIASSTLGPARGTSSDVLVGIEEDAWRAAVAERIAEDPAFLDEIDKEIQALPSRDQAILGAAAPAPTGIADPSLAKHATLGFFREDREPRAARERLGQDGITAVVFGHTHEIVDGAELDGDLRDCLFNPGTWIPHLDLKSANVSAKIKSKGLTLDMLGDTSLYVTDRRAVHIVPDGTYAAKLKLLTI